MSIRFCVFLDYRYVSIQKFFFSSYFVMQCKKYGFEFNGQLDFWDLYYYSTLIEETKYSVDKVWSPRNFRQLENPMVNFNIKNKNVSWSLSSSLALNIACDTIWKGSNSFAIFFLLNFLKYFRFFQKGSPETILPHGNCDKGIVADLSKIARPQVC
jgi:hypothetical protein